MPTERPPADLLLPIPAAEKPVRELLSRIVGFIGKIHSEFSADTGGLLAGAVAFFASLSLVPFGLLVISLTGHLIGSEQASQQAARLVDQYLPGSSAIVLKALEVSRAASGRWLVDVVGALALLWSGMNLFTTLSLVLTIAWVGEPKRTYVARKLVSFLAVLAAAVLFLVSVVVTGAAAGLSAYASSLGAQSQFAGYVDFLNKVFGWGVQLGLAAAMFFVLYWLLPAGRTNPLAALVAALPASLLWLATRYLFAVLVAGSSRYGQLYGPLAGAVLLLLWIYYSAYILIWNAELGAILQKHYWPRKPRPQLGDIA